MVDDKRLLYLRNRAQDRAHLDGYTYINTVEFLEILDELCQVRKLDTKKAEEK